MSMGDAAPNGDETYGFPGWRTLAVVLALYMACIAFATYPAIRTFRTAVPCCNTNDPLHLLFVMRWYKSCLLQGRAPFLCPEIQHPAGAPLAFFDPARLESLIYIPLSFFIPSDTIIYNLLFFFGYLGTGLATFLLAWSVVGSRASACLAGLLAMLSTPMMSRGILGHLVLIQLGSFPLFLIAWIRFVDRPSRSRLFGAFATYLLMVLSAHYFVVMVVFPACLYVAWGAARAGRSGLWAWLRGRAGWFAAFVALVGPCLVVLYSTHLWVLLHGRSMDRSRFEFDYFRAPPWAYLAPSPWQQINKILPGNMYVHMNKYFWSGEYGSYLGVVTLGLMAYAALSRVRSGRASYWWAAFGLLAVLSLGGRCMVGSHRIKLPGDLLWKVFFAYRYLRVPARFNLFACVCAAVLAGAGLKHLLGRLPRPWMRAALSAGLFLAAVVDLSPAMPFPTLPLPSMPACYTEIIRREPDAKFLEAPVVSSGLATSLNAACAYWQTFHRGRTSGGYSAHINTEFDPILVDQSPFSMLRLMDSEYLKDPDHQYFPFVAGVRFEDYLWLYLTVHDFDYVVLHPKADLVPDVPLHYDRIKARLRSAQVYEDEATTVYSRALLAPPTVPVALCNRGWVNKKFTPEGYTCLIDQPATLTVYNPEPDRTMTLGLLALSDHAPRTVRILRGDAELARWEIRPDVLTTYLSPPLWLPAGLVDLTIVAEDERNQPSERESKPAGANKRRPEGVRVGLLVLNPLLPEGVPVPRVAEGSRAERR